MIYLDHCATTPVDPRVAAVMEAAQAEAWGNPSSVHAPGRRARAVLNAARTRIADLLGASPGQIVFTSGGSESNNLAIKGCALHALPGAFRLVISAFEHDSVRHAGRWLAAKFPSVRLAEVAPDCGGLVRPGAIDEACGEGASLVSVMAVNNEVGTRQPIEELAAITHRRGALFHTDGVQAAGKIPLDAGSLGCDLLSLSGHKLHGPKGIGVLYVRDRKVLEALIHGGHQEKSLRAGTENVPAAAGMAEALAHAVAGLDEESVLLARLESTFLSHLRSRGLDPEINGAEESRVAGILNLSFRGIESNDLVIGLDLAGISISAGAACSSGIIEPSHVLTSMGLDRERVDGGIRVSFGRTNTVEEAHRAADEVASLCGRLLDEKVAALEERA